MKSLRWVTFNEWQSVALQMLHAVDSLASDVRRVLDRPAPEPPAPVAIVLIRGEQKFGDEWRETWHQAHVVVVQGNRGAQFQASRLWRNLSIVVCCDLERVRIDGVFVGTDLQSGSIDAAPLATHPGEVPAGVMVRVLLSQR